jgi:hypothetical protein
MRPLLQQRQRNVQADERQHDQEAVRHRVIAVDHRLLDRFADNQEQDEIEGRQLAQRPPPDHAQEHHSRRGHGGSANDRIHHPSSSLPDGSAKQRIAPPTTPNGL